MRQSLLLTFGLVALAGCQTLEQKAAEPVVPPPLKVKAAAPVSPDEVTKANAATVARRLSEECDRDAGTVSGSDFNP